MVQTADTDSRTGSVMQAIRQRIDRRALTPGARLPSVRAMAESAGVSKSTVVVAYDRLAAEGVIRSRPGAGFFVAAPLAPLALAKMALELDRHIDPLWMLRQMQADKPDMLKPGGGSLPTSWMPGDALRKGLRRLTRSGPGSLLVGYGDPAGPAPMRRLIARRMMDQGVDCAPDQILLTDSGTHAIDLVLRFIIQPGDTVLVDDPGYYNFQALLRAHRAKVISVPLTPTGPDLAAFEQVLIQHRPRLYLTVSAMHNPTGVTLSAASAHRILRLSEAHDLLILEDDIFADFEDELSPRDAAFDGLDRVIRVGCFTKSLSSAFRCGHIAARRDWIAALTDLHMSTAISGNPFTPELLHGVLTDGGYRHHMEQIRARLSKARSRAIRRLKAIGVTPWVEPASGLFIWCRLPLADGASAGDVARRGLAENIAFAPGNVFSVTQSASHFMRFNVSMMEDERVFEVLDRLCRDPWG